MKILAAGKEISSNNKPNYKSILKAEALRVLELYQSGIIREIYFNKNNHAAILILECNDEKEATDYLNSLPLVNEELTSFDIIPLIPYTGFSRLFD